MREGVVAVPRTVFGGSSVRSVSTVRIVLLAALGLLILSGAAFGVSEALHRTDQARSMITSPVRKIVVRGDIGDVSVRAGLTGDVVVDREDAWTVDRPSVHERFSNGVLTIETRCGGLTQLLRCRSDLSIDAPPTVDVSIMTQDGDIALRGLSGRTEVETKSGSIRTQRLEPVVVRATSKGGDVSLDLFGQPARTEAESDGGDVHVTVPYGPYRVDATADTGEVKVEGVIRDDLAPQRIAALTKVGDITVRAR
jgi:Putative adhesin